jgi:thioredoxin reductase (NADPH)
MLNHVMKLDVEIKYEKVNQVLKTENGFDAVSDYETYQGKSVIIATGNEPRRLGVENEDELAYNGISWCAICDGPIYKGKDVVVIGGGNSAVEEAQLLASYTNSVTIIQNLSKLTAEAKANEKLINTPNVKIYYESTVSKFIKGPKGLEGVMIKKKDGSLLDIPANGAFEYVGMIPVTSMVKDLGVTTPYGYILANAKMETSVKGLFACGDVTEKQIRQVITAAGDGAVAAQNVIKYLESLH